MNARAWFYTQSFNGGQGFNSSADHLLPVESRSSVGMKTVCDKCGDEIIAGDFVARYVEGQPVQKLHPRCA